MLLLAVILKQLKSVNDISKLSSLRIFLLLPLYLIHTFLVSHGVSPTGFPFPHH